MKYFDSNIIGYAFYRNSRQEACQRAIREGGMTNVLGLIEAYGVIARIIDSEEANKIIRGILSSNIAIIDMDTNLLFDALKKSGQVKNGFIDHIHQACALSHGCECILSYDKDFDGGLVERREPE